VAAIPITTYNGADYREFGLDANDAGSDDWMSVDVLKIFIDNQFNLGEYDPATELFGNDDNSPAADKIYDMDPHGVLMRSQSLSSGSGVSDISVLVPVGLFPDNCFYGSLECDSWLYFYSEMGEAGVIGGQDYNVTAGFEEWRVRLLPVVNVTKTAVPTFDRSFDWTVDKTVDPATLNLFDGQSDDVTWSVTPTRDGGTDTNFAVNGEVTVTNPTGGTGPIADAIPATINSLDDLLTGSINVPLTCPVTFPTTLDAGESFTCTYSHSYASAPVGEQTNTATANIDIDDEGNTQDYSGSATFDFADATPIEIDGTAHLTDQRGPLDQIVGAVDSGVAITYPETFTCPADEGDHSNTATLVETDSLTPHESTATTTVNCYRLSVEKDANTSHTRDYDWQITKERFIAPGEDDGDGDPSTLTLDPNQTYIANYHVTVSVTGFVDSNWHVSGTITITNPAPMAANGVAVNDEISVGISAAVDCDPATPLDQATVDIPANSSKECTYSADLPDGTQRINTATATLFGVDSSGSADVIFDANSTIELVDECVNVTDDAGTPLDDTDDIDLGQVCVADSPHTFTYTLQIGPFAECGPATFENTATFVVGDDENDTGETGSASYTVNVDVPCPQGCTLTQGYWKTHNDSFWGGAPTDPTWDLIGPDAEQTIFFLSGKSYFDVMWTPGGGNAYYILAKQYIAAKLNMLAGADGSAITTQFATATTLFNTYTPAQIGALKGNNPLRQQFISLAGVLGQYNEGLIGPGHCDEDGSSSSTSKVTKTSAQLSPADLRRWALMA
jgi:hypothetical protein